MALRSGDRREGHPFDVPTIASLASIELAPVTVLVGDNGTGKSTLVEALAVATGFNAEGGDRNLRFETHSTHSELHEHLTLRFDAVAPPAPGSVRGGAGRRRTAVRRDRGRAAPR